MAGNADAQSAAPALTSTGFDKGAKAWADYNRRPLGRIRHEVTWHNLVRYLPRLWAASTARFGVLDAGGGSGELALRLARHGYQVWLLDEAPAMIERARQAARALPSEQRSLLTLCPLTVADAPATFAPGFFDVIACHTLIEYLPEPRGALSDLAGLLREGGLISVSFVNRHAEVLRRACLGTDPAGALAALEDGAFCARLFDLTGRAHLAEEVSAWLAGLGFTVAETCGIRAFADLVPSAKLEEPGFFEALLELELAVASLTPFKDVARYRQVIATREPRPEHRA